MRAVLYIDRSNLFYYGGNIHNPLSLQPPQTIYSDMEIIDYEQLATLIYEFVKINKIQNCPIAMFFSAQSCFKKEFLQSMAPKEFEIQKKQFIESVPFDKVLSMTYSQKKDVNTVIAVNRDLAYFLKEIFTKLVFEVEVIVPSFALFGDQQPAFNINTAQEIVKHFSSLAKISFPLVKPESIVAKTDQYSFQEPNKSNMRQYIMIGVFVVLILFLVYMVFFFRKVPLTKKNAQNTISPAVAKILQTKPTNTPIPSPTEVIVAKTEIQIRILNGSGISEQAVEIRDHLESSGYTHIDIGNAPTQESPNTSIMVKPSVQIFHREEIDRIVTSLGYTTVIRENKEINGDVLITTRKNISNK